MPNSKAGIYLTWVVSLEAYVFFYTIPYQVSFLSERREAEEKSVNYQGKICLILKWKQNDKQLNYTVKHPSFSTIYKPETNRNENVCMAGVYS